MLGPKNLTIIIFIYLKIALHNGIFCLQKMCVLKNEPKFWKIKCFLNAHPPFFIFLPTILARYHAKKKVFTHGSTLLLWHNPHTLKPSIFFLVYVKGALLDALLDVKWWQVLQKCNTHGSKLYKKKKKPITFVKASFTFHCTSHRFCIIFLWYPVGIQ
jgi:hypothetical protein